MLEGKAALPHWQKIGIHHHHGINVPLFSLHSQLSSGIGEYLDLLPLIRTLPEMGFDTLQLLPLNDTGQLASPYSAISAQALNPLHISLHPFTDAKMPCHGRRVNYPAVRRFKLEALRTYFDREFQQISGSDAYQSFVNENTWLDTYAAFLALKQDNGWTKWQTWSHHPSLEEALRDHPDEVNFHKMVQYFAFTQMKQVKQVATECGVYIKGDLPILLRPNSADVYWNQEWFDLTESAGAPPDMYAPDGQDWGFPLYRWDVLEKAGFPFWRQRLKVASDLYHLYRVDHVVGLFRIWAAKAKVFRPKDDTKWIPQGRKLLTMMLEASPMLPIAEDLGVVPDTVRQELEDLGIPGTSVIRWERKWETDGSFIPHDAYRPLSLSCVSTHDSELLGEWWTTMKSERTAFCRFMHWKNSKILSLKKRIETLQACHQTASLFHVNLLGEYLAIRDNWCDPDPSRDRINVPGLVADTNWSVRIKPSVEEITSDPIFKESMRQFSTVSLQRQPSEATRPLP